VPPVFRFAADMLQMFFIGFVFFQSSRTQQGVRSQLFGIFAMLTTFMSFVEQAIPYFVISRSLYEVRERPSKTYSWKAFMFASIIVEMPWSLVLCPILITHST
jgi:ATP-binding cassette, subfamily G (WHITE), member 2, PDR